MWPCQATRAAPAPWGGRRTLFRQLGHSDSPRGDALRSTLQHAQSTATAWPFPQRGAPLASSQDRTYVPLVDRRSELENMRRSIAMLNPKASALDREQAMALLRELQEVEWRLRTLQDGLQKLLDAAGRP